MGCTGSKEDKSSTDDKGQPKSAADDSKPTKGKASADDEPDFCFKLLIVGDISVGKSNLVHTFATGGFAGDNLPASTGADYVAHDMVVDGQKIRLKIWDTAGQEKFQQITASYYRGSQGALICYDSSRKDTFSNVENWAQQVDKQAMSNVCKIVVGCKADLPKAVSTEELKAFAEGHKMDFRETSAKDNINVTDVWEALARLCIAAHK